jgi:hypothetical protein
MIMGWTGVYDLMWPSNSSQCRMYQRFSSWFILTVHCNRFLKNVSNFFICFLPVQAHNFRNLINITMVSTNGIRCDGVAALCGWRDSLRVTLLTLSSACWTTPIWYPWFVIVTLFNFSGKVSIISAETAQSQEFRVKNWILIFLWMGRGIIHILPEVCISVFQYV